VIAKLWIKILIYFPASSFLFVNTGTGEEFVEVLVTGSQQMHHIHIVDKDGSTPPVGLGQLVLVSRYVNLVNKKNEVNDAIERN
jgi:hypothetical protein